VKLDKIRVIMEKEFDEIMKNRLVLCSILLMPLIFAVIVPLLLMLPIALSPNLAASGNMTTANNTTSASNFTLQLNIGSGAASALDGGPEELIGFFMMALLPFFMMLPAMLPIIISSYSIIGEKKNRTLEPLLAAPVSVYEIMIGKAISAMIPALLATWVSALLFFSISEGIVYAVFHTFIVPDLAIWLVGLLVLAPLLAFLGILVTLVISSRVNDPRVAQQISVIFLLPLMGLFIVQMSGMLVINAQIIFLLVVAIFVIDAIALRVANTMFDREEILTRWK
jgi:ABC-2 type transport system permease protein